MLSYRDDYMEYDELLGQFVLTEKALVDVAAIDIRSRLSAAATVSPEAVIARVVATVSNNVYGYMYEYSIDNDAQKNVLCRLESARQILFRAMIEQAIFVCFNGDQTLAEDPKQRANYLSKSAELMLNKTIPELGTSLLYTGM